MQGRGAAAGGSDLIHHLLRGVDALPGVHIYVVSVTRQTTADSCADSATAPRDQRPLALTHDDCVPNTMLARPVRRSWPPPETVNSYNVLPSSPASRSAL